MPNQQAMELWFRQLEDLPYKVAEMVLNQWVATNKWSPSIADIREQATVVQNGEMPDWGEGWEQTIKAIRRFGFYRQQEALESLDPLTRQCVERLERLEPYKRAPLADWQMSEAEALAYCREKGINWNENGIDLYTILDRVSCWCCNKNLKELRNIREFLPKYWERLIMLQQKIDRPMKRFRTDPYYGDLGNLRNLERYWKEKTKLNPNYRQVAVSKWSCHLLFLV